ncbi:MAG: alpha/beta hydrolase fold domain-containing protein [Gammaproteobacteria bacterium]|nr:alpha/beta hydrolase fold domain-containing protein [Gammaproteobacteria bacterium]MBQ0840583.1 alpha/beta hydrolase fold domain-containing protein [Gammaproteobacteria bacterium]
MSWQIKLLNITSRIIVKPFVKRAARKSKAGQEQATIDKLRRWVVRLDNFITRKHTSPIAVDFVEGQASYLWVNNLPGVTRTVLYLHGGGMIIHVPGMYKKWAQRFGPAVNARVLLVDYRLAPENPYPASNDDCFAAYQWLVKEQGVSPDNIIIAGDSAGGYLTLATLLRIGQSELANPACAIALSPLSDFSFGSPSIFTNEAADPLLSNQLIPLVRDLVLGDNLCTDPMVSPVYADLSGFPPLQVHVSSNEILRDDGVRIVNLARQQGASSELCEWHKTTHVHPIMDGLPESDLAVQKMQAFIERHC